MADANYDFGPVERVAADAIGTPGHRTFRLLVTGEDGSAALWLEKEELQALGVAIDQLLARVASGPQWKFYGAAPEIYEAMRETPSDVVVEFKVGQLSIGYENDRKLFVLLAHDTDADPEGPATFTCMVTASQLRVLSQRIGSIAAAGRPRCPICGEPVEAEEHFCVRSN